MILATVALVTAALGLGTTDARAQQPPVKLRTYYSPLHYLADVYAAPAAGAAYLFYPDELVQFEALVINKGTVPLAIRTSADLATHLSFGSRGSVGEPIQLPRDAWTLAADDVRIRPPEAADVPVAAGSSVVLHPDAALIFPIAFKPGITWPSGVVSVVIDFSFRCEPECTVVPFSNLFRFEMRTTLEPLDRMETAYRRALRAFFDKDWDAAERALQTLYAEAGRTPTGLHLHGRVAEARGDSIAALRHYRAAEAGLLAGDAPDVKKRSTSFLDDFLHTIRSSIRRLAAAK